MILIGFIKVKKGVLLNTNTNNIFYQSGESNKLLSKPSIKGDHIEISGFYKPHDKFRVELKLEYLLNQNEQESNFLIETYLFIPQSLGATSYIIRSTDFFRDIKSYMRYAVQPMELTLLSDLKNTLSPIARVFDYLQTGKKVTRPNEPKDYFTYESKIIVCIFRETLKAELFKFNEAVKGSITSETAILIYQQLQNFYHQVILVQNLFYEIDHLVDKNKMSKPNEWEIFQSISEFFYYEMNLFFISIFEVIRHLEKKNVDCCELKLTIQKEQSRFSQFAQSKNFIELQTDSPEPQKERYIYREGKLKKYVASILFLTHDTTSHKKTEEFLFAIAAGVNMLFAVLVAVFTAIKWGINSLPWILSAVLVYMVRDRGKAWMQEKFRNLMPIYLAHRTQKLIEENVGRVGTLKEWLSFKSTQKIPEDIRTLRSQSYETTAAFEQNEDIIYYRKLIQLNNETIRLNHQRVNSVANILRFNLKRFCAFMDDPNKAMKIIHDGKLETIIGRKVYHLNLICKITSNFGRPNASSEILNLKVIISREGIERIESPSGQQINKFFDFTWYTN